MAASPTYTERYGVPTDLAALQGHTLLVADPVYLTPSSPTGTAGSTFHPNHCIRCSNVNMLIKLAKAGAGLAMLWNSCAHQEIESGELVMFASVIAHQPRPVSIVYVSREYLPRRTRLFIEHVKNHYRMALSPGS